MYQYDPEAYRQFHDEKTAQLRSDFQRPQGPRRSNAAERCARFVRSVRLRYKLVTIGALVAALAIPATAASQGARARHARVQIACAQAVVFPPGRSYGMCGHKIWIRDSQTGQVKAIPFWRLQRLSDPREDQP